MNKSSCPKLLVLASLLQRNMTEIITSQSRSRNMQQLFCFLHTSAKLRSPVIAASFNTTAEYIGHTLKGMPK